MKKLLMLSLFLITFQLLSAQVVVKGTITSAEDGTSVIGASVVVKGTSIGVVADIDGKYSITASDPNATLVFACIGYKSQEIVIANRSFIDVLLGN